jgi:hypothetical protein
MSDQMHVEGDTWVTVRVSTELLAELREWSQPVQARIIETPGSGTGWEMTFRINEADVRAERDEAHAALAERDATIARVAALADYFAPGGRGYITVKNLRRALAGEQP